MSLALLPAACWRLWRAQRALEVPQTDVVLLLMREHEVQRAQAVDAEVLARALARASRLLPRVHCLPRAVALTRWLREHGQPARLRIGVSRDHSALRAHAWVELHGTTPGDDPRALAAFAPLDRPPADGRWTR